MQTLLSGGKVYTGSAFHRLDVAVDGDRILCVAPNIPQDSGLRVFDVSNLYIVPGLVDVHVHLREPGFSYKETIATGTAAAARGGYTCVCTMPNLDPAPDSAAHLAVQLELIRRDARVRVIPVGCITKGEHGETLADMADMADDVIGFSDDGRGVQSRAMMRDAMRVARRLGKPIIAHCEDNALLGGTAIHAGVHAARFGIEGITSESEWRQVERDIELVAETGCRYHVCHISTKESVELIRQAKQNDLPVSCETAPHYLTLCDAALRDDGRFKMNPPIRAASDRDALVEGVRDGTIDVIATDHAPHSAPEKAGGLRYSSMGIVGLETAFPLLYTRLVETGQLPLETLIDRMAVAPRRLFGLDGGTIEAGAVADITVLDLGREYVIDSATFLSKGRATPFEGVQVHGECAMTMVNGGIVWNRDTQENW